MENLAGWARIEAVGEINGQLVDNLKKTARKNFTVLLCKNDIFQLDKIFPPKYFDLVYHSLFRHHLNEKQQADLDKMTPTISRNLIEFDGFRSYNSLKRLGKHHKVNHSKHMVDKKTKNHINGIEGFWSFAKHILYNYRGVSKYHFPMYLEEVGCRFNHRKDNLFKKFISLYFGCVSH